MIIPKLSLQYNQAGSTNEPPVQHIALFNHQILVDGSPAETHYDGDHLYWQRENPQGQQEHGILKLFSHGLMGNGVISTDGSKHVFTAEAMFRYATTVDQEYWVSFEMGFQEDDQGQKHAYGAFVVKDDPSASEQLNKGTTLLFTIVQDDQKQDVLHVHFDVDPMCCSLGFSKWISGDFNFTLDYSRFSGTLYEYDETAADYHGLSHPLSGVYEDTASIQGLKTSVKSFFNARPPRAPRLKSARLAFPQSLLQAQTLIGDINLTVEDLYSLPTPDMKNLQELSFSKLKSLMLYTIDDEQRKWFGEKKPEVGDSGPLTQGDINLVNNTVIADFLKDKFAIGYLTQAFSSSDDDKIKEQFEQIPNYSDKLNYFWKGSGDNCFSKERGYNLATAALLDSAFVSCVPGLSPYLSDQPELWAQKLYDYCSEPFTLNGLALQNTLDGRARLTHLCTLLHSLDQQARIETSEGKKVHYATALYSKVMDVRLNFIIARFTSDNHEEGVAFLTEYFKVCFEKLLAGDIWKGEVLKTATTELNDLMAELKVDNVNDLVLKLAESISNAMEIFVRFKDLPLPERINNWAKTSRIAQKIGGFMTMGVYGFGAYMTLNMFMGWNQLKPEQKTLAVIEVVNLTANIVNDFTSWKAASKLASAEATADELMVAVVEISERFNATRITVTAERTLIKFGGEILEVESPELAQAGIAASKALMKAQSLEQASNTWASIAKVAGPVAQGMTILALGAVCVCTGFQIVNDFATGQPVAIKVLDIIEMVSNSVAFLAEGGIGIAMLVTDSVCCILPVIGVVAAVVGLVVVLISMFVHRNPPPSPAENFVAEHSVPFFDSIPSPPADWLALQKKIVEHLSGESNASGGQAVLV